VQDLREFQLESVLDDLKRAEIGASFSQDIVHTMVNSRPDVAEDFLVELIRLVGMTLALLCSVSNVPAYKMSAYDLYVPFLPSLAGSRDPLELVQEHTAIKTLNDQRRAAQATDPNQVPQTRLELLITYGHRIWGGVRSITPALPEAILHLREIDARSAAPFASATASAKQRKRDVIIAMFNKPKQWFKKKQEEDASPAWPPSSAPPQLQKIHSGMPVPPPPIPTLQESVAIKQPAFELPYTSTGTAVFYENPQLDSLGPGMARIKSVRLSSLNSSSSIESNDGGAHALETVHVSGIFSPGQVGKALFKQATSDSIN
jgi:hypothetical protein